MYGLGLVSANGKILSLGNKIFIEYIKAFFDLFSWLRNKQYTCIRKR